MLLRNPNLGNTYSVELNVIIRSTLDNEIRVTQFDAINIEQQTITFSALTVDQKEGLKSFLLGNAGVQFVWKNQIGESLNCVIIDTKISFIQVGQGCTFETTLNIELV